MSLFGKSLINFKKSKASDILSFFKKVDKLKKKKINKAACLLFLEPSTRTQLSFDLALRDNGLQSLVFPENSSMKKGETLLDTLLNLEAMGFDLFIIRHGDESESLESLSDQISTPIINAGEGMSGHPTQALLDLYTIYKISRSFKKEKILFVGDIKHSRVVGSNIELLNLFDIDYAFCGLEDFIPKNSVKTFFDIEEGLEWATAVMLLRNQFERHSSVNKDKVKKDFAEKFCLNNRNLKYFKKNGIILHPGPFNRDVEISSDIFDDSRIKIFDQVRNGRKVRGAVIQEILGGV